MAELWVRDEGERVAAARALLRVCGRDLAGPLPSLSSAPDILLAGALALAEMEPLAGPTAVRWAAAAMEMPPALAVMVLACTRNATTQPLAVARIEALASSLQEDVVPLEWRSILHLGQQCQRGAGAALQAVSALHARGHVTVAITSLSWLLHYLGEAATAADALALRRQLGRWIQEARAVAGPAAFARAGASITLTEREREITLRTQKGLSNRQIAKELFLSQRTVEGHLYRAFQKLGLGQRSQLQGRDL